MSTHASINLGQTFQRFLKGVNNYPRFKKTGKYLKIRSISATKVVKAADKSETITQLGSLRKPKELRFYNKFIVATISWIRERKPKTDIEIATVRESLKWTLCLPVKNFR